VNGLTYAAEALGGSQSKGWSQTSSMRPRYCPGQQSGYPRAATRFGTTNKAGRSQARAVRRRWADGHPPGRSRGRIGLLCPTSPIRAFLRPGEAGSLGVPGLPSLAVPAHAGSRTAGEGLTSGAEKGLRERSGSPGVRRPQGAASGMGQRCRRSATIGSGLTRRVVCARIRAGRPGAGRSRHLPARVARLITASVSANEVPAHRRVPAPNGR
jgi:hypothetical protein